MCIPLQETFRRASPFRETPIPPLGSLASLAACCCSLFTGFRECDVNLKRSVAARGRKEDEADDDAVKRAEKVEATKSDYGGFKVIMVVSLSVSPHKGVGWGSCTEEEG
jgi:hypothetical protein